MKHELIISVLRSMERDRQAHHVERILSEALPRIAAHRPMWWRWTVGLAAGITVKRIREGW